MKTLINIKADKEVKEKAQKVAAQMGIPLSTLVNAYLKDLIQRREARFFAAPKMTPKLEKLLERVEKDLRTGKNLVGPFSSAHEMDEYLNSP